MCNVIWISWEVTSISKIVLNKDNELSMTPMSIVSLYFVP